MRRLVLIVEDDDALRATLAEQLVQGGEFAVETASNAAAAAARLVQAEPRLDAVLLDSGLPDGDGRELCRRLRQQGLTLPILMLTDADSEADVVRGLDAGANDYITKPFRLAELQARLRAQLRVFDTSDDAVLAVGPYLFHPAQRRLLEPARRQRITLTAKESRILLRLYRAGGGVVSRATLIDEVWGYATGLTTHTVETHICRLRRKIEPEPKRARLLLTEGGGYRLVRQPAQPGA